MSSHGGHREPIPGSFPSENEVPTSQDFGGNSESHLHQHNKLHKPEDPRGWVESQNSVGRQGHFHTGAGAGTTDDHNPHLKHLNDYNPSGGRLVGESSPFFPMPGTETEYHRGPGVVRGANDNGLEDSNENHAPATNAGYASSEYSQSPYEHRAATGAGAGDAHTTDSHPTGGEHNIVKNGRDHSNVGRADPYWGDVPHGTTGGVYNTVVGHGSHESASEGTSYPQSTTTGYDGQRAFPLENNARHPADSDHHDRNSHFKEGLAGAGAGAGAGYAAHELADRRKDDKHDKHAAKPHEEDGKESKIGALFHRDHKDEKEPKHTKTVKEDKYKEPKEEKDSKLGGLFHRGSHDNDEVANNHARPATHHERDPVAPADDKERHDHRHGKEAAAVGAAGAAAAYGAHEYHDDKSKSNSSPDGAEEKKEGKLHALFYPRSHQGEDREDPKTAKTSRLGEQTDGPTYHEAPPVHAVAGQHHHQQPQQQQKQDPFIAAGYHAPGNEQRETVPTAGHSPSHAYSPSQQQHQPQQRDDDHSNLGTYAAAGAGAAGAGYAANQYTHQRGAGDEIPSSKQQVPRDANAGLGTTGHDAHVPRSSEHGNHHPVAQHQHQPTSGHHHDHDRVRTSTDSSHGGQYNVLSSGTPSGINLGKH
ncbi:hypothetical protein F4778DRAFT_733987 [Xylariomycetidae sp. FL2044]|nr:hypothetical protein F4778DRAFT_733987 [Xylariomycetidae sp. FL2044]